jgi:hypothetical protein
VSDVDPQEIGAAVRQLLSDSLGYLYPAAMRVAVRTGVADHLADGPKTAAQLAQLCEADPGHLYRVLRFLATRGIFREDDAGAFHLTTAGTLLRTGGPLPMASIIDLLTDEMYWLPAGRLDDTVRGGTTVFAEIFGTPLFEYLAADEERGRVFHGGLDGLSATEHGGIADSYEFPAGGLVVDVGGGRGGLLHAVLARHPEARGILFDHESVVADHRLTDPAIAGRWETAAGDFFKTMPQGADVYLLKRIIHDWDDDQSVALLRACREAMADQGRVLVIDTVVPPGNDPDTSKVSDIAMMIVFDGKERTEPELCDLFLRAGLKLSRIITTPGTLSIVEAIAA